MSIADLSKRSLSFIRGQLGNPVFTWKGKDIPCAPSTMDVGSVIVSGGYEMTVSAVLRVERSEFLTADSTLVSVDSTAWTSDNDTPTPMSGKRCSYQGRACRVARTTFSPSGAFLTIYLADENR